jgi:hypothetical protein
MPKELLEKETLKFPQLQTLLEESKSQTNKQRDKSSSEDWISVDVLTFLVSLFHLKLQNFIHFFLSLSLSFFLSFFLSFSLSLSQ